MQEVGEEQRRKNRNLVRSDKPEVQKDTERLNGERKKGRELERREGRGRKSKEGKGREERIEKRNQEQTGRACMRMVHNLFPSLVHYPVPVLQRISKATC